MLDHGKPAKRPESLISLQITATGMALLTGFVELGILAFKKYVLGDMLWVSPHVVWMAPAAYLIVFNLVAPAVYALSRFGPRPLAARRTHLFIFALIGFASLLLTFRGLHRLALLLLAAGLASQVVRFAGRRPEAFHRFLRRTATAGLAILVILAAGTFGWQRLARGWALNRLPEAADGAPNVLLIILDTVRSASLSFQGYELPTTPWLEGLSQRGTSFEAAFATSPWTLPTHASLFTGRHPHELTADWFKPLDDTYPTLAEVLTARGYVTAGFVANLAYATYENGLARGFITYHDYPLSLSQWALSFSLGRSVTNNATFRRIIGNQDILNRRSAGEINDAFVEWSRHQDRPFFAFLNYYDAHDPYLPPEPFRGRFGPVSDDRAIAHFVNEAWRVDKEKLSAEELEVERAAYEGAIAYIDHELERMFDELGRRGVLENTLVIIASDHGEQFGEHGLVDHGNGLYLPALHVPLLFVYGPRVPAGVKVSDPVSLRDVPATILDLIGGEARFPGTSLAGYWGSADSATRRPPAPVLAEVTGGFGKESEPITLGDLKSLVVGHHHYILNGDDREELYDYVSDPAELNDLAPRPEMADTLRRYRELLDRILNDKSE